MEIWRCVRTEYVGDAWSGEGASLYGGRYNRAGDAVVYASGHPALAVLEVLAGGATSMDLEDYSLLSAEIPDKRIMDLLGGKDEQAQGQAFLQAGYLAMEIPSVVVPGTNYLLNPVSEDWGDVTLTGETALDPRLWQ